MERKDVQHKAKIKESRGGRRKPSLLFRRQDPIHLNYQHVLYLFHLNYQHVLYLLHEILIIAEW